MRPCLNNDNNNNYNNNPTIMTHPFFIPLEDGTFLENFSLAHQPTHFILKSNMSNSPETCLCICFKAAPGSCSPYLILTTMRSPWAKPSWFGYEKKQCIPRTADGPELHGAQAKQAHLRRLRPGYGFGSSCLAALRTQDSFSSAKFSG